VKTWIASYTGTVQVDAIFAKEQARSCESPLDFLTRNKTVDVTTFTVFASAFIVFIVFATS